MDDMHHDHGVDPHTVKCSVEGCVYEAKIHAHDDGQAKTGLSADLKAHAMSAHPDVNVSDEEMSAMVGEKMTKAA